MRKFKVVRKWPHGPNVGTILSSSCEYSECDLSNSECLEEVKEPEEFWWVNFYNHSKVEKSDKYGAVCVDPSARFQTKESAEKFAKALKESHGKFLEYWINPDADKYFMDSCEALNDRVK